MIITFEEHTFELTDFEHTFILPRVANILTSLPMNEVITNHQIVEELMKDQHFCTSMHLYDVNKIDASRIRKIIHVIRATDRIPLLIASGKGYMKSDDDYRVKLYIKSLEQRLERIAITKNAIKRQFKFNTQLTLF